MPMIDYETYTKKFGTKDERSKEYHSPISKDVYDFLSKDDRFGIAFQNEIFLALMNDVFINIGMRMISGPNEELSSWKKLAELIKKILVKFKDDNHNLNDRYYEISASPEERDFFFDNPIKEDNLTLKTSKAIGTLGMFYRAMSTNTGEAVCKAIVEEKQKAIALLYEAKQKNGASPYYAVLNFIIDVWGRRVGLYERESKKLKIINRSIKNERE